MANIDYFNSSDYKGSGHIERINAIESEFLRLEANLNTYLTELTGSGSYNYALGVGGALTDAGYGALTGAAGGSIIPGVGTIGGAIIGGGLGLVKGIFGMIAGASKAGSARATAVNTLQAIRQKTASVYRTISSRLKARQDRFSHIRGVAEQRGIQLKSKTARMKLQLGQAMQVSRDDFNKSLSDLNRKNKLFSVRLGNTNQSIRHSKDHFLIQKEATYQKFLIEKKAIDKQLNVLTSRYYMADLAKDVQSLTIAKHKQQQFLSSIIPSSQGLSSTFSDVQGSLSSIKMISQSLNAVNAIEQTEAKLLFDYRQTMNDLRGQEGILEGKRKSAGVNYKQSVKILTSKTLGALQELEGQKRIYNTELTALAEQRKLLTTTFHNRNATYQSRIALLDEELKATLTILDLNTEADLDREAENYVSILDQARQFFASSQIQAKNIFETDDTASILASAQQFDGIFNNIQNAINFELRNRQTFNLPNKTLNIG